MDIKDFRYQRALGSGFDIQSKIKDDKELLKYVNVNSNNTQLIFYKDTPIGFFCDSSYMGLPEFQCGLFKEYRGMGIADILLDDYRNRKFKENNKAIVLLIDKDNVISIKSARKNGFMMYDEDEEFNSYNKTSQYYVFYSNNPNYISKKRGR